MLSHPSIGIELGDGALKAVRMQRRGSRMVVTGAWYRPYARPEDGAARPTPGLPPRSAEALRAHLAETGLGALDRIYVGFPSVSTFNQLVSVPDVGPDQLQAIVDYETHRSLRGPADDYVIRSKVLRRKKDQVEVPCLLYGVRRDLRDAFVSGLSAEGVEFDNLVPSPAAVAMAARYDRPAQGDRVVVSIGLRATEVVFLRDRGYAFRTLPLGVGGLAAFGAKDRTRRADAARKLVERILAEIERGIRFFFKNGDFRPSSTLLYGEGTRHDELVTAFRQRSKTEVEEIGSLHRIATDASIAADVREHVPEMASAIGLALAAARAEEPEIELLPPNKARAAARRTPGLLVAAAIIAAGGYFLTTRDEAEADRVEALSVPVTAAEITARRIEYTGLKESLQSSQAARDAMLRFADTRGNRATLLSDALRLFGPEVTDFGESKILLRTMKIDAQGEVTSLTGRARTDLLDVGARTVLRQRLASIPLLRDITVEEDEAARDEFSESTELVFDARIRPIGEETP